MESNKDTSWMFYLDGTRVCVGQVVVHRCGPKQSKIESKPWSGYSSQVANERLYSTREAAVEVARTKVAAAAERLRKQAELLEASIEAASKSSGDYDNWFDRIGVTS